MGADDKRPNTAGYHSKTTTSVANGAARPGSADISSTIPVKLPNHLKITDIIQQNRQKKHSSADLIKEFENGIRKVVENKRNESDKLKFIYENKKKEIGKLKLLLKDLKTNSAALGMNEYPDRTERMESITSVSRRPIYAKKTNIRGLEDQLQLKSMETAAVSRRTLTYEHIKKRHQVEKTELVQAKNTLTNELREKQLRLQDLNRVEIAANESLGHVQARLGKLKQDIAVEIQLYETELELRLRWTKEKAKFETYYAERIASIPKVIDSQAQSNSPKDKRNLERLKTITHWTQNLSPTELEEVRLDEQRHEDAFRRLGLPNGIVNPKEIIELCSIHETLHKEFTQRQAEQVQLLASTRARIEEVNAELQQSQIGTCRTNERDLHDSQLELATAEKELGKMREEFEYFHQMMQPVKAGIQQIVVQVTGETIDVNSIDTILHALQKVEKELLEILPELTRSSDETSGTDINSKQHAAAISYLNPSEITSPYNVRIRPKESWKERDRSNLKSITLRRQRPESSAAGDDTLQEIEVMDRATVKQLASTLVGQCMAKKNRNEPMDME